MLNNWALERAPTAWRPTRYAVSPPCLSLTGLPALLRHVAPLVRLTLHGTGTCLQCLRDPSQVRSSLALASRLSSKTPEGYHPIKDYRANVPIE